jgi:glucose/arabinose dehydrogenase
VATGLDVPWGIAFLPGGEAIVTERETGRLLRIRRGEDPVEVARVEVATPDGEVGLLGIAADPAGDGDLYVYFGTPDDNRIAVLRSGGPLELVLTGIPGTPFHTGGRLAFGPDGKLYASAGDATVPANAQDPDSLAGKILRLEADGSIPSDNPDPASAAWSLGHRNVEGLAWDASDRLWATEFGENRLDELNLIEAGGNYGWPLFEGPGNDPRYVDPVLTWTPAEASPAGIAFADGSLYVAALRGARLWQVPLDGEGRPGAPAALLEGAYGRIRIVELGPDGWLWIGTSNRDGRGGPPGPEDDRIVRFPPLARAP